MTVYDIEKHHGSAGTNTRSEPPQYIVVHYTAGAGFGAGQAKATCNYFSGGSRNVGAEYCIDDATICEYADPQESYCHHCGDGKGQYGITNSNSIGIEVCAPPFCEQPYTDGEIDRLAFLVKMLMGKFNIQASNVVRHYDASRKACPYYYTEEGPGGDAAWKELHAKITGGGPTFQFASSSAAVVSDPAIAYALGINAQILFGQEDIYPYVITVDEFSGDLDIDKLKEADVVGICVHMGDYYTSNRLLASRFRDKNLAKYYDLAIKANMAVGLYTSVRASTLDEAKDELYEIKLAVRRYPPSMGVWLKLNLTSPDLDFNDTLISKYQEELEKIGLKDQIGLYCTKSQLELFHWDNFKESWYWWMDRHLVTTSTISGMPTPEFFSFDDPKDEDALISPNFSAAASAMLSVPSSVALGGVSGELQSTVQVPDGLGKVVTFEKGDISWAAGTRQREFWNMTDQLFVDSNGMYRYGNENGRYVIAMRPKFGGTGGMVDIHFRNNTVLNAILGDEKGEDAGNEWGHDGGSSMVEFIVKSNHTAGDTGSTWYGSIGAAQGWLASWWNSQGWNSGIASVDLMGSVL